MTPPLSVSTDSLKGWLREKRIRTGLNLYSGTKVMKAILSVFCYDCYCNAMCCTLTRDHVQKLFLCASRLRHSNIGSSSDILPHWLKRSYLCDPHRRWEVVAPLFTEVEFVRLAPHRIRAPSCTRTASWGCTRDPRVSRGETRRHSGHQSRSC